MGVGHLTAVLNFARAPHVRCPALLDTVRGW